MIPEGIRRGVSVGGKLPLWMLVAGGVLGVILLFLLFVLVTMGSEPAVSEVVKDLPLH